MALRELDADLVTRRPGAISAPEDPAYLVRHEVCHEEERRATGTVAYTCTDVRKYARGPDPPLLAPVGLWWCSQISSLPLL
jgi:hypothetical protein